MFPLLIKALVISAVFYGPCPGLPDAGGCTFQSSNTVYVSPGGPPGALYHELGHVIDARYLSDADRSRFETLTHQYRPWRSGPNPPAEQFAEAVRMCAASARWPSWFSFYDYNPSISTYRHVCRWIMRKR